jgi:hypothetical protein
MVRTSNGDRRDAGNGGEGHGGREIAGLRDAVRALRAAVVVVLDGLDAGAGVPRASIADAAAMVTRLRLEVPGPWLDGAIGAEEAMILEGYLEGADRCLAEAAVSPRPYAALREADANLYAMDRSFRLASVAREWVAPAEREQVADREEPPWDGC